MRTVRMLLAATGALMLAAGGCQRTHRVEPAVADDLPATVCRLCYDKAVEVWDQGRYIGPRWSSVPARTVRVEHQCPECRTTAAVETGDGRWVIRCPACAPEGVACDRCVPADAARR